MIGLFAPHGVPTKSPMPDNISRLPSGAYRVQLKVGGKRLSRSFDTLRDAVTWRDQQRVQAKAARRGALGEVHTLAQAIQRYAKEVAPTHAGARWEQLRCAALLRDTTLPLTRPVGSVTREHIEQWRDRRLTEVSAATVLREMNMLGSLFSAACEWRWLQASPVAGIRRPPSPAHRDVLLTRAQIKGMLRALGYRRRRPQTMREVVANTMLLALRTGMRSGEILGLTWDNVHEAYVTLPKTKNGDPRDVPLSRKARPIIARMRGWDEEKVFPVSSQTRDALWRNARAKAGLSGFTYHDLRHVAATWIGRTVGQEGRLSFPEFCKVFGWRDPKNALVYTNPSARDLAEKL